MDDYSSDLCERRLTLYAERKRQLVVSNEPFRMRQSHLDVFDSFLNSCCDTPKRWWGAVRSLDPTSALIRYAVGAVALSHLGSLNNDYRLLHESRKAYGTVLRIVIGRIGDVRVAPTADVCNEMIASLMLLGVSPEYISGQNSRCGASVHLIGAQHYLDSVARMPGLTFDPREVQLTDGWRVNTLLVGIATRTAIPTSKQRTYTDARESSRGLTRTPYTEGASLTCEMPLAV